MLEGAGMCPQRKFCLLAKLNLKAENYEAVELMVGGFISA